MLKSARFLALAKFTSSSSKMMLSIRKNTETSRNSYSHRVDNCVLNVKCKAYKNAPSKTNLKPSVSFLTGQLITISYATCFF